MPDARILYVENDKTIAELMGIALRGAGYTVDFVATLSMAHRRLDSLRYGLVITDWRLPDGVGLAIVDRAADLGS